MTGTSLLVTRPIRLIPPMMTMATSDALTAPVIQVGIPKSDLNESATQLPIEDVESRYYIRVSAQDTPGVFARIAAAFGRHDISICSALQHEPAAGQTDTGVPVVITTHQAREGNVRNAIAEIDALGVIKAATVCLDIVDEHAEDVGGATGGG